MLYVAWSDHWQLKLSPSKCSLMQMSSVRFQSVHCDYFVSECKLPVITVVTDLGVTYDDCFKFSAHVDQISCRAALRAKLVLNCFSSRRADILRKAFCAFVRPVLKYASVIWNPLTKHEINKIESVQRRFTKAIFGQRITFLMSSAL